MGEDFYIVVFSYCLWMMCFVSDFDIFGCIILFDIILFVVIGVMLFDFIFGFCFV